MTNFAENVGWISFLALVMAIITGFTSNLLKLVWDQGSEGKVVDTTDALFAVGKSCVCWFQHMMANRLATVCTVAIFLLLLVASVSVFASFGYSAIAYAISGHLAPFLIRRLKPLAPVSTVQASPLDLDS